MAFRSWRKYSNFYSRVINLMTVLIIHTQSRLRVPGASKRQAFPSPRPFCPFTQIAHIVKYPLNWGWCAWSAEGSLKQWLTNGKLLLLSHNAMVCLAHCRQELQQKSWKTARLFLQDRGQGQDQMFKTKTKTSWSKTKTKTFIFVLEAPRDQDRGLKDYITEIY